MTSAQAENKKIELQALDRENPYYFPNFTRPTGLTFKGAPVMRCPVQIGSFAQCERIYALPMREDDILIAAYPKCGGHWISEILHMLISGQVEYPSHTKEARMIEFLDNLAALGDVPSRRVLNTHFYPSQFPKEVVEKKVKIVHMLRNPKDVVVSFYHHCKQSACEKFTLDGFLNGYPEFVGLGDQFEYLRHVKAFEKAHPDVPIKHIHYEDLKQNTAATIKDLSEFLGLSTSYEFCEKVAKACEFSKLKRVDEARELPESFGSIMNDKWDLFRKGVVGDWENHFTVAQNKRFNQRLAKETEKGFGFTLKGAF